MAKSKQTIAAFIDEYEAYLRSINSSISRVQKERAQWLKEKTAIEDNWAGRPIVQTLKALHSQETWWNALKKATEPGLQRIYQGAIDKITHLVQGQQFTKDKVQECTALDKNLGLKLSDADLVLGEARQQNTLAKSTLDAALGIRQEYHDSWLDSRFSNWKKQREKARPPIHYDYSAPQPAWAKPWLLPVLNADMAKNMKAAAVFKETTGKSLYAVAQGYEARLFSLQQAKQSVDATKTEYQRVETIYNSLVDAKINNERELERSMQWILPETGSTSLIHKTQDAHALAIEYAIKYCILNNVTKMGNIELPLLGAHEHAQRIGKIAAIKNVAEALDTSATHWKTGEDNVERALRQLNALARKHNKRTAVSIDTAPVQKMARDIEQASIVVHSRFESVRPKMSQSTPFVSQPFSGNSNSNDSNFWTMAWMYLLLNTNSNTSMSSGVQNPGSGDGQTLLFLDPVKFEDEFQNANGGLGLSGVMPLETLNISIDGARVLTSHDSEFSVNISDLKIDIASSSFSGSSSSGYSSSSWSSSDSSSYSSSSSSDSSSGSSCGGGGD